MNYRDIRYKYYKDHMSYHSFSLRHDAGNLPFPYHGYYSFLWRKYVPDIAFRSFVNRVQKYGTEQAIKVGHLGHGGDKNRGKKVFLYSTI